MVYSPNLTGGKPVKLVKNKSKTMKKSSSPTLYKLSSVTSKTKKTINLQQVLFNNLKCDNMSALINTVKVVKTLGEGSTGHSLKLCGDFNCEYPISVKFSKVSKKFPFNQKHPVKVEMKVQKIVNKLIDTDVTPHFNRTYGDSIICRADELLKIKHFVKYFKEYKEGLVSKNLFQEVDKVVVSFMELGHSDLFEYLLKNATTISLQEMKGIIFQIYYTLMCMQYHEPGFKHLDLKTDNILVFETDKKETRGKFNKYIVGERTFYLPADMIQIKIFDFDFVVSDKIDNGKISCDLFAKLGLSRKHNPVQDVHYLLNFLLNFRSDYFKYKKSVYDFIQTLIPEELRGKNGTGKSPVVKYRLSNYYVNKSKECNYVPKKGTIMSPAETIIDSDIYGDFSKGVLVKEKKVLNTYDSRIGADDLAKVRNRSDMYIKN
jgi:serine/threonine protein kinase